MFIITRPFAEVQAEQEVTLHRIIARFMFGAIICIHVSFQSIWHWASYIISHRIVFNPLVAIEGHFASFNSVHLHVYGLAIAHAVTTVCNSYPVAVN